MQTLEIQLPFRFRIDVIQISTMNLRRVISFSRPSSLSSVLSGNVSVFPNKKHITFNNATAYGFHAHGLEVTLKDNVKSVPRVSIVWASMETY